MFCSLSILQYSDAAVVGVFPHDPVHLNIYECVLCVGVCVESERELQYSLLMPNS